MAAVPGQLVHVVRVIAYRPADRTRRAACTDEVERGNARQDRPQASPACGRRDDTTSSDGDAYRCACTCGRRELAGRQIAALRCPFSRTQRVQVAVGRCVDRCPKHTDRPALRRLTCEAAQRVRRVRRLRGPSSGSTRRSDDGATAAYGGAGRSACASDGIQIRRCSRGPARPCWARAERKKYAEGATYVTHRYAGAGNGVEVCAGRRARGPGHDGPCAAAQLKDGPSLADGHTHGGARATDAQEVGVCDGRRYAAGGCP